MSSGCQTFRLTGCPIRIPPDLSSLTAPRGFSQFAASFLVLQCLGILRMLLHTSTYFSCARSLALASLLHSLITVKISIYLVGLG
jgi:hypothetical protein